MRRTPPHGLATSHSLSVLSSLPESAVRPSGENATETTPYEGPVKVRSALPVPTSHSLSVPSQLEALTARYWSLLSPQLALRYSQASATQ